MLIQHEYGYLECVDIDRDPHGERPLLVARPDEHGGFMEVAPNGRWLILRFTKWT